MQHSPLAPSAHTRAETPPYVDRPDLAAEWRATGIAAGLPTDAMRGLRVGTTGKCRIICAQENGRWHLSISHPWRLPTWAEVNAARDALIPADVWLCQPMPPREYWVNVHQYCLHLWEIRDRPLLEQWAFDGCQDEARAVAVVDTFLHGRTAYHPYTGAQSQFVAAPPHVRTTALPDPNSGAISAATRGD